jgi:hypothetical protein
MPGWRTEPSLPVVRANLTQLGVVLPGPDVEFTLVYAPTSVRIGTVISGLTLVLLAAFFVIYTLVARRGAGSDDSTAQLAVDAKRVHSRTRRMLPYVKRWARDFARIGSAQLGRLNRRTSCPNGRGP